MSHRKRKEVVKHVPEYRPGPAARLVSGSASVLKQQVRWMAFFVGIAFICQVIFATVPYPDVVYFAVMGGSFMGLAMPGRLWE